jgi:hypothetical protein
MAERDLILDESAVPDPGETTPPHGDEVVNELRNASRHLPERADDPDTDRPAK